MRIIEAAGRMPSITVNHGGNNIRISADVAQALYTPDTINGLPRESTGALAYIDRGPGVMDGIIARGGGLTAQSGVEQTS